MSSELKGDLRDVSGRRVVLHAHTWHDKILRRHPELAAAHADVLRTVAHPDHAEIDPVFAERTRYFRRAVGPSRWLLVVVSYEQEPARIVTAFALRKDPPWNT